MKFSKLLFIGSLGFLSLSSCSDSDDGATVDGGYEATADLYATSHNDGNVTKYDLITGKVTTFMTTSTDAEGIYYSADDDSFTQASRSAALNTSLETYLSVSDLAEASVNLESSFTSSNDLKSPRDLAVNGNIYVVSDNSDVDGLDVTKDGRFFIYTRSADKFTLRNVVTVDFKVWGIEFVGNDLYAVVDTTNKLAVFANFTASNTADASITATKTIAIEGIIRTHGLDFDGNTMVMTDIGDASSDVDGGIQVIADFATKFNATAEGGTLALAQQSRIAGAATLLGNPVNVVYDADADMVYVAELANGGGRVLAFQQVSTSGQANAAPFTNNQLKGVSSLYLHTAK